MSVNKIVDALSPLEMTKVAESVALYKASKSIRSAFYSAVTAGVFISMAFVFYITATISAIPISIGLVKLVGGVCFSMGLILIVFCGADLFTSTILTIIPKATKAISFSTLIKNWFIVYVGNFIGAILFIMLMFFAKQHFFADGLWGLNVLKTASYKLEHSFVSAVCLGTLANLMVCLAVWLSYAGRSFLDKMFAMILPVSMFVACGFEHSIANMFIIPLGIIINNFAPTEFWELINLSPTYFSNLTFPQFVINNLIPVTIGNILGGMIVGLTYWKLYLQTF